MCKESMQYEIINNKKKNRSLASSFIEIRTRNIFFFLLGQTATCSFVLLDKTNWNMTNAPSDLKIALSVDSRKFRLATIHLSFLAV